MAIFIFFIYFFELSQQRECKTYIVLKPVNLVAKNVIQVIID